MRLELKDIKAAGLEQDYSLALCAFPELERLAQEQGPRFEEPIRFNVRFQRSGRIVEADGRFKARVQLECSRCLQPFKYELSEPFALTFTPATNDEDPAEDLELEADELGLIVYQDDVLDLREPLQEQLIVALPIAPLCSRSCRGLCPECGGNLNAGSCGCSKKVFNNKFDLLSTLKIDPE